MYYEEKIINGVLCYRNDPNREWTPFTIEALSTALVATKHACERAEWKAVELERKITMLRAIL